ncbi:MAG: sigma-54-dependent Fis family transcriptional regulator [Deltaproteobacteria bacterium]|nr:sigma-54-dependent Fis family transcriptional regulator [Deltaproteobacteria bacterium]
MAAQAPVAPSREIPRHDSPDAPFVLVVDDEPLLLRSLRRILEGGGYRTVLAESTEAAEPMLSEPKLGVVLADIRLGRSSGLEILEHVKRERPEVEVIMMTGNASIENAVGCIRRGAFDYLAKPFDDVHRIRNIVGKALERRELVQRNRELEMELHRRNGMPEMIGHSSRMRTLARTIHSMRHNESHVLIEGESGTGKELVARGIHAASPRSSSQFVPVDCGALPETIIESELFGHEKGAFTGAVGSPGLFRMADGGTLFLDEIGEIPLNVQAKLLRALQNKEVRPVGASNTVPVDIRVISATHRDLADMVSTGAFRADLYYRLNVVRVDIPPLRDRSEDIPLLVHHFLDKHRTANSRVEGIEDEALEVLVESEWPGNVRELENVIESAFALAPGPRLRVADLPRTRRLVTRRSDPTLAGIPTSLEAYECSVLERALRESGGDASAAASLLGIGRSTFYRKLAKHGLTPS